MSQSWRAMDRATRSAAYDNGAAVANSAQHLAQWKALSASFRAQHRGELDIAYGPRPRNRLDLFPAERADAPLLVFIHGGYWQRNAKDDFSCMASGPLAHGVAVALVGYTLAPEAPLTVIVEEVRAALAFLRARDDANGIARRMIVSGWSAGGHLAALAAGWPGVDSVLAISGIFDLAPLRGTSIDDRLHISLGESETLSPAHVVRGPSGPLMIAHGARELPELCRQSRDFHVTCLRMGLSAELLPVADADHFSVLDMLIAPSGVLTKAVVALAERDQP